MSEPIGVPPSSDAMPVQPAAAAKARDLKLLARLGGDFSAAASCLCEEHGPELARFCWAFLAELRPTEEALSSTLASALGAEPGLRGKPTVRAWLFGLARRECARKCAEPPSERAEVSTVADADEPSIRARRALAELPPSEREALLLKFAAGLEDAELAACLGSEESILRERVTRGLERLSASLSDSTAATAPALASACSAFRRGKVAVLTGAAEASLREHLFDCEHCRDDLHRAERAVKLVRRAGDGFVLPADLAERVARGVAEHLVTAAVTPETSSSPAERPPKTEPQRPAASTSDGAPAARAPSLARKFALPALGLALLGGFYFAGSTAPDEAQVAAAASGPSLHGRVARISGNARQVGAGPRGGGLESCTANGATCRPAAQGDEIPIGAVLRTDPQTLVELVFSEGSKLILDRNTTLRLEAQGRGVRLERGALVADIARDPKHSLRIGFAAGTLEVLGTKFALRVFDDSATTQVARGQVRLADARGRSVVVENGEEGRVFAGSAPVRGAGAELGEAFGWSDALLSPPEEDHLPEVETRPRALGELRAKKPGQNAELRGAVTLARHAVRVNVAGNIAHSEIEEVFENHGNEVLEGIFRFPLPPDAKIERLALEVDGKLEEGAFVDRDQAAAIFRGAIAHATPQAPPPKEEIIWVPGPWRDPALLEWQRGGRFELRIFPIPKRGSRRIILAYSQLVRETAGVRHYNYPLALDPSRESTAAEFSLDVTLRGHDAALGLRTPGWELERTERDGVAKMHFSARNFVPNGDFQLDYALPDRASHLAAWAYRDPKASDGEPYVALALRPELPAATEPGRGRAVTLVVDASRSVFGENQRRAVTLATRIARDLPEGDRVTALACDSTCRELPDGPLAPGPEAARRIRRFLENEPAEGASDVTYAVSRGLARAASSSLEPAVIYIGDGAANVGPTRPATIERAVRAALPQRTARVSAVGIGPDSDGGVLIAMARGGGGVALPYVPGEPLADVALAVQQAIHSQVLRDPSLRLPEGLSQIAPATLEPIVAGSEVIVVGRMNNLELAGEVVLTGKLGERDFEQHYRLQLRASESNGNAFVPRLFASGRIADLEREIDGSARAEALALSVRHGVASRYTSLLVLESTAMYQAFGLDHTRHGTDYFADEEAEGTFADAERSRVEDELAPSGALAPAPTSPMKAAPAREYALGASGSGELTRDAAPKRAGAGPSSPGSSRAAAESDAFREFARAPEPLEPLVEGPRRPFIPMRRIWERRGEVLTSPLVPRAASGDALALAESALRSGDPQRSALKKVLFLRSAMGDLAAVSTLVDEWLAKEPLDPEALTALADLEARRGQRERAIRVLGSVLDVRPGDIAAHKRLARLERWAGHLELACRHSIAIAEGKSQDLALVSDAVRCARQTGMNEVGEALLGAARPSDRAQIEAGANRPAPSDTGTGDLRLDATFSGGADLDLALIDTEGHRISWLGAATRSVISARDVTLDSAESLSLRGAAPGEYVVELTRGSGAGTAHGVVTISVAGRTRAVPFTFTGERTAVALVRLTTVPRLVPL